MLMPLNFGSLIALFAITLPQIIQCCFSSLPSIMVNTREVIHRSETGVHSFDLRFFRASSIVIVQFIPAAAFTDVELVSPYVN